MLRHVWHHGAHASTKSAFFSRFASATADAMSSSMNRSSFVCGTDDGSAALATGALPGSGPGADFGGGAHPPMASAPMRAKRASEAWDREHLIERTRILHGRERECAVGCRVRFARPFLAALPVAVCVLVLTRTRDARA
jgi:hypothetical protein